jgi:AcrR family transcriptional regulator
MSVPKRTYLKSDDRRRQILGVAKDVFVRQGYRDVNVADICEAAKIGRGTLYQYFDNKRDVLRAVIEDICGRIAAILDKRTRVAAIEGLDQAPLPMIVAFCQRRIRELVNAVFEDEATLRLVLRDARGLDGVVDEMLAKIDALLLDVMETDTRVSQQAGLIRADLDPRMAALFVLGGVEKVVLAALAGEQPVDLDKIVNTVVQVQLFGVLAEEVRR